MAKRLAGKQRTLQEFKRGAKKIEKLAKNLGKKVPSGLRLIGEEIMLDAKASRPGAGVPVKTGALRSSGRVEGPLNDQVTLSFGGAAAPYALEQHENVFLHHRVGEARYLVHALERWQPGGASARAAMTELQRTIDQLAAKKR